MSKKSMSKTKLLLISDYFEKVDQANFEYFSIIKRLQEYAIIVDIERFERYNNESFAVVKWTKKYTRINNDQYYWLFYRQWNKKHPVYSGVSKRIHYLINNGLPENWRDQMWGNAPLCY